MTQERFSNLTVLNRHKERRDKFDPPPPPHITGGGHRPLYCKKFPMDSHVANHPTLMMISAVGNTCFQGDSGQINIQIMKTSYVMVDRVFQCGYLSYIV